MARHNKMQRSKGRAGNLSFVQFPHRLMRHPKFNALSAHAVKALMYLASQFTGTNNGDLGIAWKVAKPKGFTSNAMLRRGTMELIEAGFVIQSRQGGRNRCSLFALSWFPIDECNGKLDISATRVAPNTYMGHGTLSEPPAVQLAPPAVQSGEISKEKSLH
jgi:hypothetical protein